MWRERWMYLFILPGFLYFVVFRYLPLLGNVAAFQDYSPYLGFSGSSWVGLTNFVNLFTDPDVAIALKNTLVISLLQIVFAFPAPILLALLLNSIMSCRVRRFVQSVVYLPHFIGWVILISLWQEILGGAGLVNQILQSFGAGPIDWMSNPETFKLLVVAQVIWKEIGWGPSSSWPRSPRSTRSCTRRWWSTAPTRGGASGTSRCPASSTSSCCC
ncbi:putative aldouronate transport system permease protein [Actinopolymorpha cephalotaxi]|nr:putative aldouronate transport system permease protein [Actinopolymorpha cephalotaxi]